VASAYKKIGFTPATWCGMTARGVRRTLAGSETALDAARIHAQHLVVAEQARAEGYNGNAMMTAAPTFNPLARPVRTFEERIEHAATLKLNGISQCLYC
jgi:hypothetical protein